MTFTDNTFPWQSCPFSKRRVLLLVMVCGRSGFSEIAWVTLSVFVLISVLDVIFSSRVRRDGQALGAHFGENDLMLRLCVRDLSQRTQATEAVSDGQARYPNWAFQREH